MIFKKSITTFIVFLFCFATAFASQSTNFISNPTAINSGGGKSSSANNINFCSLGLSSFFNTASPGFSSANGFLITIAGQGDVVPPSISNVKFDGQEVAKNDLIKKDASLTATVQDTGGISPDASSVTVDNTTTYFKNFVSPSSYNLADGSMTYKLNLNSGTHTITISAMDNNHNSSTYSQTLQVETGEPKATATFVYPNPFDPNHGRAKFAYQLNQDTNITLYLFNEINQVVWQKTFSSGTTGGKAGYNEIEWGGETDFGGIVDNGGYFLRIVSGGKVIGKIKVAVLKRQ